jgi:hypothetical protein
MYTDRYDLVKKTEFTDISIRIEQNPKKFTNGYNYKYDITDNPIDEELEIIDINEENSLNVKSPDVNKYIGKFIIILNFCKRLLSKVFL